LNYDATSHSGVASRSGKQCANTKGLAQRGEDGPGAAKRCEEGSAVIIFITLLAIMMILVTANSRELMELHRDIKLLEQRQIQRLDASQTNAVVAVEPPAKRESQ
jgi:hypothetical protein